MGKIDSYFRICKPVQVIKCKRQKSKYISILANLIYSKSTKNLKLIAREKTKNKLIKKIKDDAGLYLFQTRFYLT